MSVFVEHRQSKLLIESWTHMMKLRSFFNQFLFGYFLLLLCVAVPVAQKPRPTAIPQTPINSQALSQHPTWGTCHFQHHKNISVALQSTPPCFLVATTAMKQQFKKAILQNHLLQPTMMFVLNQQLLTSPCVRVTLILATPARQVLQIHKIDKRADSGLTAVSVVSAC